MTRTIKGIPLTIIALLSIIFSVNSTMGQAKSHDSEVTKLIGELQSPKRQERMAAFYGLLHSKDAVEVEQAHGDVPAMLKGVLKAYPGRTEEIKVALIRLLEAENAFMEKALADFQTTGRTLTETDTEFYADVVWALASLKDERSLHVMLGAITTGNMATSTLASFGRKALDPVLEKLSSQNLQTKHAAMGVIVKMLKPQNIEKVSDPVSKTKIKKALLNGAKHEDHFIRMVGIEGLARLRDRDAIPLLEKIAREDPYENSMHGGDSFVFPVRDEAKKTLAVLKADKQESPRSPKGNTPR